MSAHLKPGDRVRFKPRLPGEYSVVASTSSGVLFTVENEDGFVRVAHLNEIELIPSASPCNATLKPGDRVRQTRTQHEGTVIYHDRELPPELVEVQFDNGNRWYVQRYLLAKMEPGRTPGKRLVEIDDEELRSIDHAIYCMKMPCEECIPAIGFVDRAAVSAKAVAV